jgi:hypothetical protein
VLAARNDARSDASAEELRQADHKAVIAWERFMR